ncbi:MAG: PPOX class F420-dependent oxidoreductase [Gaiellaceae bacterium]
MSGVGALASEKYISLTTFKQDGTSVATPVWVVSDDGRRLLVWTGAQSWKVKRLRRDPRVLVSASDYRGRTRGESREGVARLLEVPQGSLVEPLLNRKYGLARRLLGMFNGLARTVTRKQPEPSAYIEIVDP